MYKQYFKPVLLLCVLIFIVSYYFTSQNQHDKVISESLSRHIELISVANEISSYAKRAEGHLLLFLMLKEIKDREKFFKRTNTLEKYINKIDSLIHDEVSISLSSELKNNLHDLRAYGNQLLIKYDNHQLSNNDFVLAEHASTIKALHTASSNIRKIGVKFVENSTSILDKERLEINNKNKIKYQSLAVLTLVTFLFLIVISYQSGKLSLTARMTKTLEKMSYIDALTGVANRRSFDEQLDKEWRRSVRNNSSIALLFIDVDYFKKFNDTYGHSGGDNCLVRVAMTLRDCLKRPSDFIGRYGGEEFVVILPETTNPSVIAEICRSAIEELHIPHKSSPISEHVTVSIGYAVVTPDTSSSASDFINLVDEALYKAKDNGRNCIYGGGQTVEA